MGWLFFFGGKNQNEASKKRDDGDGLSDLGSLLDEEFSFYEEPLNDVYFMNPGFASNSFRAPSASPVPGMTHRQPTRRLSSRVRDYKRLHSVDASEFDLDVALAPSAFALQMIPNGMSNTSFCSRDDSEIATRMISASPDMLGRRSGARSPYINAMYLHEMYSQDDSDVGSTTMEKIHLRHMGSALSYRLELSGTPDYSIFGDDESCISMSKPGHSRRYSDMSDRLSSFRERNKMVRLESIVGGMQKKEGSVLEFGVLNADQFANQPTPRLFRSSSEKLVSSTSLPNTSLETIPTLPQLPPQIDNTRIESFPISFLTDIVEEDEDDNSHEEIVVADDQDKLLKEDAERPPSSLSSLSELDRAPVMQSSFKVRVAPFEVTEEDGFTNPAFEVDCVASKADTEEASVQKPIFRMESVKKNKSKKTKDSMPSRSPRRRSEKRDESLHFALLERYLVESAFNKYLSE